MTPERYLVAKDKAGKVMASKLADAVSRTVFKQEQERRGYTVKEVSAKQLQELLYPKKEKAKADQPTLF